MSLRVYKCLQLSIRVYTFLQVSSVVYNFLKLSIISLYKCRSVLKMSATVYKRPNVKIGVYKSLQV